MEVGSISNIWNEWVRGRERERERERERSCDWQWGGGKKRADKFLFSCQYTHTQLRGEEKKDAMTISINIGVIGSFLLSLITQAKEEKGTHYCNISPWVAAVCDDCNRIQCNERHNKSPSNPLTGWCKERKRGRRRKSQLWICLTD